MNLLSRILARFNRAPDYWPTVPPLKPGEAPNPSPFRLGRLALNAMNKRDDLPVLAEQALAAFRREVSPEAVFALVDQLRGAVGSEAEQLDQPLLDEDGAPRLAPRAAEPEDAGEEEESDA